MLLNSPQSYSGTIFLCRFKTQIKDERFVMHKDWDISKSGLEHQRVNIKTVSWASARGLVNDESSHSQESPKLQTSSPHLQLIHNLDQFLYNYESFLSKAIELGYITDILPYQGPNE